MVSPPLADVGGRDVSMKITPPEATSKAVIMSTRFIHAPVAAVAPERVHRANKEVTEDNRPRRHRDTEILCVSVSLWLTISVLSASSVLITRTSSWIESNNSERCSRIRSIIDKQRSSGISPLIQFPVWPHDDQRRTRGTRRKTGRVLRVLRFLR